jgi:hypothetical protein
MGQLTTRQALFVEHYALCNNAAEAARLAGYSAQTARVIGPENLSKPAVKAALEGRQQAFRAEMKVTKDQVISALLGAIQMGRKQQNPAVIIAGLALKKSELYSSLWKSCDELRGGMDASQYKDYVLVLLFVKYVSDKYAGPTPTR